METPEKWTFISLVFISSVIQMPSTYYLPDKKIVGKLSVLGSYTPVSLPYYILLYFGAIVILLYVAAS